MAAIIPTRPLSLRISVTDSCNLRCLYCRPGKDDASCRGATGELMPFAEIAQLAAILHRRFGLDKIRITGGEPLLRPDLARLVASLAETGVPELALTTNGTLFENQAAALKAAGLRRVNVSLDSPFPVKLRRLTRGGELQAAKRGLDAALAAGLSPVKLNTVVVRDFNAGEVCELLDFALERNCELRFIELMPIGPGAVFFKDGFVSSAEVRQSLERRFVLQPLPGPPGSAAARRWRVRGSGGRHGVVGFVSSCSQPFCGGCTRLRLTADGRLLGCLAKNGGISVRALVRAGAEADIEALVMNLLCDKRTGNAFEQEMLMAAIGG